MRIKITIDTDEVLIESWQDVAESITRNVWCCPNSALQISTGSARIKNGILSRFGTLLSFFFRRFRGLIATLGSGRLFLENALPPLLFGVVCFVAFFGEGKEHAYAYWPRAGIMQKAVSREMPFLEDVQVRDYPIKVKRGFSFTEAGQLLRRERRIFLPFAHSDSWAERGTNQSPTVRNWREGSLERKLPKNQIGIQKNVMRWRLPHILDVKHHFSADSQVWIGHFAYSRVLWKNISPQLALRTAAHYDESPPRHYAAYYSEESQNPISSVHGCGDCFPILFGMRLVICVSLCIVGILLAHTGPTSCLREWIGSLLFFPGLILLVVPFHWEWYVFPCQETPCQQTEYRQTFQHDAANVPLQIGDEQ